MTEDMDLDASPTAAALQAQIQALTALAARAASLRRAPALLLRPPSAAPALDASNDDFALSLTDVLNPPSSAKVLGTQFQRIKEVADAVLSVDVQAALTAARESERADDAGIAVGAWRAGRADAKRKRQPSPESPQPYPHFRPKVSSVFPLPLHPSEAVSADGLVAYIRALNRESTTTKLHIWRPPNPSRNAGAAKRVECTFSDVVVLRLCVQDVLLAFITLENVSNERPLVVESVVCFGPREKKAPHLQSDWVVYQHLSQELAKMIHSYPQLSVQQLVSLLSAYHGLFVQPCSSCGTLLRPASHMPPLVRTWTDTPPLETPGVPPAPSTLGLDAPPVDHSNESAGRWEPHHLECARQ